MIRKLEELRLNLEEFVHQTDYSVFSITTAPAESVYVASLLDGLDVPTEHAAFLVYPGPFRGADAYLRDLLSFTDLQLQKAAKARHERRESPPAPLPPGLGDTTLDAAERLER